MGAASGAAAVGVASGAAVGAAAADAAAVGDAAADPVLYGRAMSSMSAGVGPGSSLQPIVAFGDDGAATAQSHCKGFTPKLPGLFSEH